MTFLILNSIHVCIYFNPFLVTLSTWAYQTYAYVAWAGRKGEEVGGLADLETARTAGRGSEKR
jgi:hypothetical protein